MHGAEDHCLTYCSEISHRCTAGLMMAKHVICIIFVLLTVYHSVSPAVPCGSKCFFIDRFQVPLICHPSEYVQHTLAKDIFKRVIDGSFPCLYLKGEFYNIRTHAEPPFKAQPFTVPQPPGYMLSVGLSDFTLNSASYGLYSAGLLQALINDSMIPPYIPLHLNTSSMGPFIPELPKMFPGLLMNLQIYAREMPMFSFQPGVVKLGFQAALKASAIQPNGTQIPLFKLNADFKFSGKMLIADGTLKGSMAQDNFTLTLVSSEVGTIKIDSLAEVTMMGMKVVLAKVNVELGKGVLLPRTRHVELVNTVLEVEEGFIAVSSDAQMSLTDRGFN